MCMQLQVCLCEINCTETGEHRACIICDRIYKPGVCFGLVLVHCKSHMLASLLCKAASVEIGVGVKL